MTVKIGKHGAAGGLLGIVEEIAKVDLGVCYQCQKCSNGCPVAGFVQSPPSEIIRRLHLGAGDELLASDIVWMCVSCGACQARCPMSIDVAAVMDALRTLALERRAAIPKGNMPLFNRLFLGTVRAFGRTYDLPMIALYKLGTRRLTQDMEKFPPMLAKRKIAVLPPSGADKTAVRRIFSKTKRPGGTGQ